MRTQGIATFILTMALASGGCGGRTSTFSSGQYQIIAVSGVPAGNEPALRSAQVSLDRAGTGSISLGPGSESRLRFAFLPRSEWFTGCPTNLSTAEMETARLDTAALSIGGLVQFDQPMLVAQCRHDSTDRADVALRNDSAQRQTGGGGCGEAGPCLVMRLVSR